MPPQPPYFSPQGPIYTETNLKFAGNPYVWSALLGTGSQLVVPSRPRRSLFFFNPGPPGSTGGTLGLYGGGSVGLYGGGEVGLYPTGSPGSGNIVYVCPAIDANGNPLAAAMGGPGCIEIPVGTGITIGFNTQAFNAAASGADTPFTVWEFL